MHNIKDTILKFLLITLSIFLWSCASSGAANKTSASENTVSYQMIQEKKQLLLENTFKEMLQTIGRGVAPDSLLPYITEESRYWLDDLEQVALSESKEMLSERPFHEILAVLMLLISKRT